MPLIHTFRDQWIWKFGCQTLDAIHTTFLLREGYKNAYVISDLHIGHQNVTFNSLGTKIGISVPCTNDPWSQNLRQIHGSQTTISPSFLENEAEKKRLKERIPHPPKARGKKAGKACQMTHKICSSFLQCWLLSVLLSLYTINEHLKTSVWTSTGRDRSLDFGSWRGGDGRGEGEGEGERGGKHATANMNDPSHVPMQMEIVFNLILSHRISVSTEFRVAFLLALFQIGSC
jgi:hypothetical protein